ncbi:MerC domain-containing protein [Sphingomonas sp. 2R-10]|uniref:MerC domain-containing protein n=1 Tax=Sphingomonas sp. 2R-10 TaxID=3045148 RepID=UPI000F78E865|nr:MerC domain-containing protein [Sphingomonas sp. 2R-10]MDJ0277462.1 MerC domain-containing protein [Sphingomonas sp. 2R-10]
MSHAPPPVVLPSRRQRLLDGFAVAASLLCLVHCLLLPLLLVALPVLATILIVPEAFHAIAFALAVPTSLVALGAGYRRHRRTLPAALALMGLALLGTGAFAVDGETVERIVTSIGGVVLAAAHLLNWRAATQ